MIITIKMLFRDINFAWRTRRFWFFTATSRTRARFARTTLGSFWLGFSNLLSISTLGIVYGTVFSVDDFQSYFIYLGIGLVIWNAISSSISSAPDLFAHNSQNIRNINIKPIFYTLEEWAFQIQTFFQSFILVFLVFLFINRELLINFLLFSWLPMANLIIFLYWFPLLICLIGVKYTDFSQLVPIILQLVFLTSPILYRKDNLGSLQWITDYNLIYKMLDPLRTSLIEGQINYKTLIITLLFNILGLTISFIFLNRKIKELPFLV
tara:strand:- start:9 stop:806 length:798 start_codon:yes stop_codon:yes gene_type:complete